MYGLPQKAGRLSQLRLISHLQKHGYYQCENTPRLCLFKHESRDITFCRVVARRFRFAMETQDDADHLIHTLRSHDYEITIKSTGDAYLA